MISKVFSGTHPFPNLRYDASLVAAIMNGQRPACPLDLRGDDQIRNGRLWRLIQICWHANPQFRPVMSDVNGLMEEIIGDKKTRQCVLKEFVILGRIELGDYLNWVARGK